MDRNEEIKKISELLYNEYISNGWKNVSTEGCERQAINYIDVRDLVKKLTLTDVVDSKRFTETDLLNGYQAGCIEGLDDCCDLGLDDLKEIKEDGEKWVKRYTE